MKNIILLIALIFCSCKDMNENVEEIENVHYNHEKALELMSLNNIAYNKVVQTSKNYDEIKKALEDEIAKNDIINNNELIWLGVSRNNENLTYVVRDTSSSENTLSIVSRGTIFSLVDIAQDIEVYSLVKWNDKVSSDIKISKGIHLALEITMSLTSSVFGQGASGNSNLTLKELLTQEIKNNEKTMVYMTGHSLGGAITTGMTLLIVEDFYNDLEKGQLLLSAFNFAGQTLGNNFFADYYNTFLSNKSISFSHNRIVNQYDVVPFAFGNLDGIKNIGYPYSEVALVEVEALIKLLDLGLTSKKYTHVGDPAIKLNATLPPPNCESTVKSLIIFGCWAAYEHQPFYYVDLLKNVTGKE